jgi:hypothetical protein
MTAIQRIRQSTNMPATEAIKIHASQGCSKALTASTLNISVGALNRICKRFNLNQHFKPRAELMECCKSRGTTGKTFLYKRLPVLYNGIIYWPSDPTNAMVHARYDKNERRKFIAAARTR